ncbi:hypothetical protein BDZ85DRAFT_322785 [Elsinoe ampelina]|uniref:Rhodopsin domain-containing protein n=1 Tax=Elsinoe ampelina TaxID=302913 RepID=A0A6A6FZQ3_9PEZI|nr:hypothetical protein BDZ85DRAFT_322785 [Elsinoe ampelina]
MLSTLLVVSICLLAWTIFTLLIRVYMRMKVNGPWGFDDWVAVLGTISVVIHTILALHRLNEWSVTEVTRALGTELAINILYLFTVASSRISTGLLLERLERKRANVLAIRVANSTSLVWLAGGSIALGALERKGCATSFPAWSTLEATSILLELAVLINVVVLVWDLKMPYKQKSVVTLSFALRLVTIGPYTLRLVYLDKSSCSRYGLGSNTALTVTSFVAAHVSIMVATFSCVKQFLGAFDTGAFGTGTIGKLMDTQDKSYEMSQVSNKSVPGQERAISRQDMRLRPDNVGYTVTEIETSGQIEAVDGSSVASDDSEQGIIRKTQHWDVTDGPGRAT